MTVYDLYCTEKKKYAVSQIKDRNTIDNLLKNI